MFGINQRIDFLTNPVVTTWGAPDSHLSSDFFQSHQYEVVKSYQETSCRCYIVPPHLQERIRNLRLQDEIEQVRLSANINLDKDTDFRNIRKATIASQEAFTFHWPHIHKPVDSSEKQIPASGKFNPTPFIQNLVRSVYDAQHKEKLPGQFVISTKGEQGFPGYTQKKNTEDETANKALENALNVFLFYLQQYRYDSIDGKGMPITSSIHFGDNYENAFWDGKQMIYGDGSELFKAFVYFLDVVGHELTHGVTGNRLTYEGEAGALNEHFSDVMGYLVYMFVNKVDVKHVNWLLADGILQYDGKSYPLRSFANPGTAYDIPDLGKDPQPATYGNLYQGNDDNGGVHINSGIPNHAFYLFAMELGGYAWEKAGFIWFKTMMTPGAFKPNASMKDFAQATINTADTAFKEDQQVRDAIRNAWKTVEVIL